MLNKFFQNIKAIMTSVSEGSSKCLGRILSGRVEKPSFLFKNELYLDEIDKDNSVIKKRPKSVRYALLLAYQGNNYYGMQIQPKNLFPTIESHLLFAMKKFGILTEEQIHNPGSFFFQRAARTDRRVSAVRQVCSMLLPLDYEFLKNGTSILNSYLPADIRVLDIRRATPSFHAQKTCDSRTYSYTLPTFAFASCFELTNIQYRINDEQIANVDDILSAFNGTHNFYNYTARREHGDQSCRRFIISFKCDRPFIYHDELKNEDVEFITVYIRGQSFMLHQIRKMIGATIAVVRNLMYKSDIQKSFEKYRMDIPKAPGNGLLLEQVHYERYDKKYGKTHAKLDDWGDEINEKIQQAKEELILKEMLKNECESQSLMQWLSTLSMHKFVCNPEEEIDIRS